MIRKKRISPLSNTKNKIIGLFLAFVLLLTSVCASPFVFASSDGGYGLTLSWSNVQESDYVWDSSYSENKTIRLKVSYSNQEPEKDYGRGDIVITVPGIGSAVRGTVAPATDVAADSAGITTNKNWSYTYNSKTDVYTFTNNVAVTKGSPFLGSFELLWILSSRDTIADYSKQLTANLQTSDNFKKTSNTITYSQKRTKDKFSISQLPKSLYSADGITGGLNPKDYYWVGYPIIGNNDARSYAIGSSYYKIKVPEGAIVTYAKNSINQQIVEVEKSKVENDTYLIKQNAGVDSKKYLSGYEWTYIYIAYPRNKYTADSTVTTTTELWGKYLDANADEKLCDVATSLRMGKYEFEHYIGNLYSLNERAYGTKQKYSIHSPQTGTSNTEEIDCYTDGFLNATDLTSGKRTIQLNFGAGLYGANLENVHSLEFGTDFFDVLLNSGNYRQLNNDEYEYTSVEIPSSNQIHNENGISIKPNIYEVEVYATNKNNPTQDILVSSTKIINSNQTINLPTGTIRVYFKIKNIAETINFNNWNNNVSQFKLYAKFQVKEDSSLTSSQKIKTDFGYVQNSFWFCVFDKKGDWINNKFRPDFGYDNSTNIDIAQRDMETYGRYMERTKDVLHVHEIISHFYNKTQFSLASKVNDGFDLNAKLSTYFQYADGSILKNFSISTILPKGVRLPYNVETESDFLSSLTFSGMNMTNQELFKYVKPVIIKNYKNSGCIYIRFDFDFSTINITNPTSLDISFKAFLSNEERSINGSDYSLQSSTIITDTDYIFKPSYGAAIDNGEYNKNKVLWEDINNNTNKTEILSNSSETLTIVVAVETHLDYNKSVATEYTNGQYFNGTGSNIPKVGFEGSYNYKLKLKTAQGVEAQNITFFDNFEQGSSAKWQGDFAGVDVSYVENLGFKPTIYYSLSSSQISDLSAPGWITTPPADLSQVKSVAVNLGNKIVTENTIVYVLIKMIAPKSEQLLVNQITENGSTVVFDVINKETGSTTQQVLNSSLCQVFVTNPLGRIVLTKTDGKGTLLPNAIFSLYKSDGTLVKTDLITSPSGTIVCNDLEYGDYYFVETGVPKGYELDSTPINVKLENRTVYVDAVNERKLGSVKLIKRNSENQQLFVEGAVFSLYTSNGSLVEENLTTNDKGEITKETYSVLGNLEWNDYYFVETKAPTGYQLDSTPIKFTINADSVELPSPVTVIAGNNQAVGANLQFYKYERLEDNVTTTKNPISSALFELFFITSTENKSMGLYLTDENGEIFISGLVFGKYYLLEKNAPEGYFLNTEKIEFEVNNSHIGQSYQTAIAYNTRKKGNINLFKVSNTQQEVVGAKFGLYDALTNTLIKEGITSSEGVIDFKDLNWGQYYIQEIEAPAGYELNTQKYSVTIDRTKVEATVITSAINQQKLGSVRLTKTDGTDNNIKLQNANYDLYTENGEFVASYTTGADGTFTAKELSWGGYYFIETKAPLGYGLSTEKIRFSVNATSCNSLQEVEAFDYPAGYEITIIKKIKANDIVFSHGIPEFIFQLNGIDDLGVNHTYHQAVSFNEEYVKKQVPDADGYISAKVTFTQLRQGVYKAKEIDVIRYAQKEINNVINGTVNGDEVEFDLNVNTNGEATFVNTKTVQSGTSHTSSIVNILRREKRLTAITAEYHGTKTITTSTIEDRSVLDVYAIYDDGSQRKLADNEYTLEPEHFEGLSPGNYTVDAVYTTTDGIKRKASFQVNIDPPIPFEWVYNVDLDDGIEKAEIVKYTGSSSVVRFPSQVKDKKTGKVYEVMSLGSFSSSTVAGMSKATGIIIPEGIKYIKNWAFRYLNLTGDLKLPSTLKYIGEQTFRNTKFTGDLIIPDSVEIIEKEAFNGCTMFNGKLQLSKNLKKIEYLAFNNLNSITGDLIIPDSVEFIGKSAFASFGGQGKLQLPKNEKFTSLSENVFDNAKLTSIEFNTALETIGNYCFYNTKNLDNTIINGSTVAGLIFPDNLKSIGDFAFYADKKGKPVIGKLSLPEGLQSIGAYAFQYQSNLVEFNLPSTLLSIGQYAFSECTGLNSDIVIPKGVTVIEQRVFMNNTGNKKTLTLHDGITEIKEYAFYYCQNLTGNLTLPKNENLKEIGKYAFANNKSFVNSLVIPENITSIADGTFLRCSGFDSLTLPSNIKTIGISAFASCTNLKGTLAIPDTVTLINDSAFSECGNFTALYLSNNLEKIGSDAFSNCDAFTNELVIPRSLTTIGEKAFNWCKGLTGSVDLSNIKSLGKLAFYWCTGLNGQITLPNDVNFTSVPSSLFYGCSNLNGDLIIPEGVTTISEYAFFGCQKINSYKLPSTLKSIEKQAFYNCNSVAGDLIIPEGVTTIGDSAFSLNSKITSITLPSTLTSIGNSSFSSLTNVSGTITVPIGVLPSAIGTNVFLNMGKSTLVKPVLYLPEACRPNVYAFPYTVEYYS